MSSREIVLGSVIHIRHGYAFKSEFFSDKGEKILLTPGNFHEKGGFRLRPKKDRFYTGEIPDQYILNENDLIVAMTEQGEGLLGSSAWIPESGKYLHNQRLGLIDQINENVLNKKYLYHLFNTHWVRGQISGSATGTKVKHTSPERIYHVKLEIPDVSIQEKIVGLINNYDYLIENNRRRIQLLEESARLLYQEWFVHLRFPGHEHVQIVDGVPEGWKHESVGDLLGDVKRKPKIKKEDYQGTGLLPCIDQSREFIGGYIDNLEVAITEELPLVVFGDHTRIVKYVDFPFVPGADGTQLLIPKDHEIPRVFFYFLISSINVANAFYARHFKFLKAKEVLIPTTNLMEAFEVAAKTNMCQVSKLRDHNRKLAEARDLLLPRLMNGEISV